jgi:hypothetical protein
MTFTHTMRLVVLALGAAAAAVGLATMLAASPASAGPSCPEKTLCVWQHNDLGGQLVKMKSDGISNKLAKKMNNEASSVINNRNKRAYLYDRRNGKGEKICLSPKANYHDLGGSFDFNDVASSSRNTNNKDDCPQ